MKRLMILVVLIFQWSYVSFASENNDNLTANIGLSMLFVADAAPAERINEVILFSSLAAGLGYHFNIVPHLIAPGIYGDVHISFGSLLQDEKKTNDFDSVKERDLFFQAGIRLYNQFRFGQFDMQPFAGINIMAGKANPIGLKSFGILMAYKNFGLEYGYILPIADDIKNTGAAMHRFAIMYHFR